MEVCETPKKILNYDIAHAQRTAVDGQSRSEVRIVQIANVSRKSLLTNDTRFDNLKSKRESSAAQPRMRR